jgi:hypothetical protein
MSKNRPSHLRLVVDNTSKPREQSAPEIAPVSSIQRKPTQLGEKLFILPPKPNNHVAVLKIPKAFDRDDLIKRAPHKLGFTYADTNANSIKLSKVLDPNEPRLDRLLYQLTLLTGEIRRGIIQLYGQNSLELEAPESTWSIQFPMGKRNNDCLPIVPPYILEANSQRVTLSVRQPTANQLIKETRDALTHSLLALSFKDSF